MLLSFKKIKGLIIQDSFKEGPEEGEKIYGWLPFQHHSWLK
jgi:hypothetical protein